MQVKRKTITISVFIILLLTFLYLTLMVAFGHTFSFDEKLFNWSHAIKNERLTDSAAVVTYFGSRPFLLPANITLAAIFLLINKKRYYTWKIAAVSLSSFAFLYIVKYIIQRPRPGVPIGEADGYSFPSGHTFTGMIFFGLVSYFAYTYIRSPWKQLLIAISVLMVLAIGWSRIYLRVHYASDVIAALCLGVLWMILARWILGFGKRGIVEV